MVSLRCSCALANMIRMSRNCVVLALAVLAIAHDASSDVFENGEPRSDTLEPSEITRVVRAHGAEMRRCYTDALKKTPNLRGKVRVHIVIAASGRVSSATDEESDMPDLGVRKCITDAFMKLVFRATTASTHVVIPFLFVPDMVDAGAPVDAGRG